MGRVLRAVIGIVVAGCLWAGAQPNAPMGLANLAQTKDAVSKRASSSDPAWDTAGNGDARPIAPGATLVLADLEGPGVINHIWFTIAAPEKYYPGLLALRMYWDDEEQPSVEAPVGDFFAMGHGLDIPLTSLPVSVTSEGRARNCYWPMPFGKHARIEVTNEGNEPVNAFYYYIDWEQVESLPANTAYFHAMYRQEYPARVDSRYMWADIEGRGHYVGTVHSVRARTPSWIGEGDDFFYIDGEKVPSLKGTGTEDYFCDAWGFREMNRPFYGAPLFEGFDTGDRTTVYRWHITDPIRFSKSLYAEIEHVGPNGLAPNGDFAPGYGTRLDDIASVAFWYQEEPHKVWEPMPIGHDRLYPEEVAGLYLRDDAYPPYVELALRRLMHNVNPGVIVVQGDNINDATFTFMASNPSEMPAELHLALEGDESLVPDPTEYTVALTPGTENPVTIGFNHAPSLNFKTLQPVAVRAEYRFKQLGGKVVTIPVEKSVIISRVFTVPLRTQSIAIDGDVSDWGGLPFAMTRPAEMQMDASGWRGPDDCRANFGVAQDDQFLYVAVKVVDDQLELDPDMDPWQQDGVEIRVTALPDEARKGYKGGNEFEDSVLFALSPASQDSGKVFSPERLPKGARYACSKTPDGFAAEIAIPVAYLDAKQGKPWHAIRLNIAVDDRDGNQQTQLWWRPDWRREATFDDSGTFVKP